LNRKAGPGNDAPWVGLAEIHEYRANKSAAISALQKAKQILERGDKHSKTDNLQFVGIKLKQLMALTSHEAQMGRSIKTLHTDVPQAGLRLLLARP
jgi:hypothetical protein